MDYFKKCPECGRYMTPHLEQQFGYAYTRWTCPCGYVEGIKQTLLSTKTTFTGGETSDRTVDREMV